MPQLPPLQSEQLRRGAFCPALKRWARAVLVVGPEPRSLRGTPWNIV